MESNLLKNGPLVSIVLPVYNGERYLRLAIDSILDQEYENLELIIVDDASTDSTPSIVREYKDKDKRIVSIINSSNLKLPGSLNIGFEKAKGAWHTWTSDDNILHSNYLSELLKRAIEENSDFLYSDYEVIDENGQFLRLARMENANNLYRGNCVGACFIYKAEIFITVGKYDETKFMYEDYDYWVRIQRRGFKMSYSNELHPYSYRIHSEQLSNTRKLPNDFIIYRWNLAQSEVDLETRMRTKTQLSVIRIATRNKMFLFALVKLSSLLIRQPLVTIQSAYSSSRNRKI
jgi:glycosyltransferase involved in cell wall biosynthesis